MESFISVFFGVCFPHTVDYIEEDGIEKFYMAVYEPSKAFFVKVVGDSRLLEKAIKDYVSEWDLDAFVTHKDPIMVSVGGSMFQQEIGQSFLGPVLEEKFHAKCSSITLLSCLPSVPKMLKDKVHPDISPKMVQEEVKNGYFLVNHSLNQTFVSQISKNQY
ncbi:hypothetical protein BD560DRAFT_336231 [Blakeslea trispora]|nr:hypothetical protein BD560DRAFT_336231 [Blakeslea trispora]